MKTIIAVKGTHCASCKAVIEDVCKDITGITSCSVDFKTGKTIIEHEKNINWSTLKKEIESVGTYKVILP